MPTPQRQALQRFASRRFADWNGLAPGTRVDDVAAALDLDRGWHGTGALGSERRPTDWLSAQAEGFPKGVRVWVEGESVRLLDAEGVALSDTTDALLDSLGAPEAELESYLGTLPIAKSERVHPARGLTVYLNPENRLLLRVAAYAPCSLDEYLCGLRLDLRMVRLPPRRHKEGSARR